MPPCWPCLVCERVIVDGKAGLARSEAASFLAAVAGIPLLHRTSIQLALAAVRQAIGVANPGALSVLVSVNLTLSQQYPTVCARDGFHMNGSFVPLRTVMPGSFASASCSSTTATSRDRCSVAANRHVDAAQARSAWRWLLR